GHIQDDMIRELMLFIAGAEFQSTFEAFFLKHALKFTDDEEHRLEYTQLFQEFQELFEQFMQQFYLKNNITEAEFGKRCRAAVKNDAKASQYLEVVLASMDYQAFHSLMKFMRRRAMAEPKQPPPKRKLSAKDDDDKPLAKAEPLHDDNEGKDTEDDHDAKESKRK
ncbi:hypothetical protein LEN26_003113, partial [Aphanomyces euteiches]